MTRTIHEGTPGDILVVGRRTLSERARKGEILEVFGEGEHTHYRVRWEDDHESLFYPSNDAMITQEIHHAGGRAVP
jgi:hypothetical protein